MSTMTTAGAAARPHARECPEPRVRHLRLVPTGARWSEAGPMRRRADSLRLTRRGRVAATMVGVASAAAVLVLGAILVASLLAGAPGVSHSVQVQPGQTLSEIAVTELPGMTVDRAVTMLVMHNGLAGTAVQAGQELEVPVP